MGRISYANRGLALEEPIVRANEVYCSRKLAVVHKVPTAWIPIRGSNGKIISAKVEKKASVDFLGHVKLKEKTVPIAFDVTLAARS